MQWKEHDDSGNKCAALSSFFIWQGVVQELRGGIENGEVNGNVTEPGKRYKGCDVHKAVVFRRRKEAVEHERNRSNR
jgi:hypothetical protein